ncbi:hypothetical protein Poli38472_008097 [Pythium oligandrum]|uniref:Uncharacterized protein n=1 Tax=Pythium oligandrum TaxID=41045 RepID=A0A8K1CLI3_PYTOL|nr:hypothetical protein Poli38472_008097 [Pythium oligandrum]|eukprot:TMW65455.1 hypothetical protein Poli38472_008097 [Pythium oligandrum]
MHSNCDAPLPLFSVEETKFLLDWAAYCDSKDDRRPSEPTTRMAEAKQATKGSQDRHGMAWTQEEHERFLQAVKLFPSGPWKRVAEYIGTRSARQTRTHAQKYKQKMERRRHKMEQMKQYPVLNYKSDADGSEESMENAMRRLNERSERHGLPWTPDEHERFLKAIEQFPNGPWRLVAAHVGTRTVRQVMTHGQKYREKMARHQERQRQNSQLSGNAADDERVRSTSYSTRNDSESDSDSQESDRSENDQLSDGWSSDNSEDNGLVELFQKVECDESKEARV